MPRYVHHDQDLDIRALRRDLAAALRSLRTITRLGRALSVIVDTAIADHIYEKEPKRCPERTAVDAFDRAIKEAGV